MKSNLKTNPLGQEVKYTDSYDASLLFPIDRNLGRSKIFSSENMALDNLPFKGGYDIWNCYEVSWLALSGKPEVRIVTFAVPFSSPNLVESKSLKLYLNSFNNTKFADEQEVASTIKKDLSDILGQDIKLTMHRLTELDTKITTPTAKSIDDLDIELDKYEVSSKLLALDSSGEDVSERLYSDLLRSNCLVTGQPDWGSVEIAYEGKRMDHKSLLRYIISFRNHIEFHEQCVERIFNDISKACAPKKLTVYARYTRRGGIDINPYRSSEQIDDIVDIDNTRLVRQ